MMPSWKTCLQTIVLLTIAGYALVIVSGFWAALILLVTGTAVLWLWRHWPSAKK